MIVEHVAPRSGRCVRPRTCPTQAARVNRADGAKPSGGGDTLRGASQSSNSSPTAVAGPAWLPRCHRRSRPRRGRVTIWTQRAGPPLEEEPASTSSVRPERHAARSNTSSIAHPEDRSLLCQPDNGSPIAPVAASRGPCWRRVTRGAPGLRRARRPRAVRRARRRAGRLARCAGARPRAREPSSYAATSSASTAARLSKVRSPFFVIRSTLTDGGREERRDGRRDGVDRDCEQVDPPPARLEPIGQAPGRSLDHLEHVESVGQRVGRGRRRAGRGRRSRPARSRGTPPRSRRRSATRRRRRCAGAG